MWPLKADTLLRFAEPEVVFRGPITFNYLVLVLIRYIIVVKLIKPVIAYPTDRKEGLRPVTTCPENLHRPGLRPLSLPYNKEIISNTCCRMQKKTPGKNRLLALPRRGQTRPTEDFCQVSFTCIQNNVLEIIFCYSHQTIYHKFFGMCRLL